jgi:hypothetical protein
MDSPERIVEIVSLLAVGFGLGYALTKLGWDAAMNRTRREQEESRQRRHFG